MIKINIKRPSNQAFTVHPDGGEDEPTELAPCLGRRKSLGLTFLEAQTNKMNLFISKGHGSRSK